MRTFRCACKARVFFDNTRCLTCHRELGFLPDAGVISALEPAPADAEGAAVFTTPHGRYVKCANNVEHGVCNWLVREGDSERLCQACRLNNVIPDLSNPENHKLWAEVERAKRRLVYSLNRLGLPLVSKAEDAEHGLAFDIKADVGSARVLTGHADGLITLNLAEADTVVREKLRVQLNERYRTLLGHFRHEVGHYYWERLVDAAEGGARLPAFRRLFGDETADYAQALQRHYSAEPAAAWPDSFISYYAAAHPWEDWAETFAHYLHLVDTLETAHHFGFTSELSPRLSITKASDFDLLMKEWTELTVALNALNRSMGLPDAYPFAISATVREKLAFVHDVVRRSRKR
jgi:hypothetical protein